MFDPAHVVYDDTIYIKRNKCVSIILFVKCVTTLPFNLLGIFKPEWVRDYPWILFMEAFHHYHARIFFLLCLHRNITQLYCSTLSNGFVQKQLLILELCFDVSLVALHVHEFYRMHNVQAFLSAHSIIHMLIACASLYSVSVASAKMKITNLA